MRERFLTALRTNMSRLAGQHLREDNLINRRRHYCARLPIITFFLEIGLVSSVAVEQALLLLFGSCRALS